MSTNDKTGEKLLDSMRKTKAAAADKPAPSQGESQPPQKKESKPQSKKKAEPKRTTGGGQRRGNDPFQSGRRVWPD